MRSVSVVNGGPQLLRLLAQAAYHGILPQSMPLETIVYTAAPRVSDPVQQTEMRDSVSSSEEEEEEKAAVAAALLMFCAPRTRRDCRMLLLLCGV